MATGRTIEQEEAREEHGQARTAPRTARPRPHACSTTRAATRSSASSWRARDRARHQRAHRDGRRGAPRDRDAS